MLDWQFRLLDQAETDNIDMNKNFNQRILRYPGSQATVSNFEKDECTDSLVAEQ